MAGRVLGARYRVLSRLGEGGMGTVYLCEHAVLGRRYAVKVLRPDCASDPEAAERFRNEAIAASRIGGGNVVDVLDFGTSDDGALYYVMEALDGRSLAAVIAEDGPLDVPRALALLEQICGALGAAHARGVVHRDVKPDNVFVVRRDDGSEQAKVLDFGISKVTADVPRAERLTAAGTILGTPEYMAPEQGAGDPVDHRADVYALGVLAYEMLTGTLPIVAATPVATLVAHQTRTPDPPSQRRAGIPPELDALLLAALAKRPEDRPASMEVLAAALAAIRCGAPASPSGPRPYAFRGRRARAGRRGLRVAALVAAAAVVVGAAALWARSQRRALAPRPGAEAFAAAPEAPQAAPPAADGAAAPASGATKGAAPSRPAPSTARDDHLADPYRAGALKPNPFR